MAVNIYPIPLGVAQCYVIQDKGAVMIDAGAPKKSTQFLKTIEHHGISPNDIKLIIPTHGHWDHIGSAKDIKQITGARIAMHHREKEWLEKSQKHIPPAVNLWGHIIVKTLGGLLPLIRFPAAQVDITLEDEDFSLTEFEIPGKIIYTPGHSPGSVSVLLDTGDAFVGDLAMSSFPLRLSPGLPIFADDITQVKNSLKLLLDKGATTIYPAHGKSFPAELIRTFL
ncbi:MAG: MBL fold metallo-hydrolase [Thermodesulfobacteriota bacterium]|nr:MBL fold metallo-hydrolase [Thermodesulfobacteriota bacterium]